MSDANIILHAIQSALNAAIATAVAEATKPLLARIEALENNPAIGVDTTLEARVMTLETKLTEAKLFEQTTNVTVPIDEKRMVEALNSQEWFWEKVNNYIDGKIEEAIDDHLSNYDHDQYDEMYNEWGGESVSEFIKDDDLESQINDALRNASFEVRVTL
jgi:hypothetical protein